MSSVFLTEANSFEQAQVIKSLLKSNGLHPHFRDENMRSIGPHLNPMMGRIIIDIPEIEFLLASQILEQHELEKKSESQPDKKSKVEEQENLAKKVLISSILGCLILPIAASIYSMILGFRLLKTQPPLNKVILRRLALAVLFNSLALIYWLTFLPHILVNK